MPGISNTNNYISTLVSVGNDAESHLYELSFEGGYLTDNNTALRVRCAGFQPPEISQDTYPVRYITAYIDRPRAKITVNRYFTLKFRVDDSWNLYKALLRQQQITSNPAHHFAKSDIKQLMDDGLLFNVSVDIISELNDVIGNEASGNNVATSETIDTRRLYNFKNCWIEEMKLPTFTGSASDAVSVDVKICFLQMEDWQSGLTGDPEHGEKISISPVNSEE